MADQNAPVIIIKKKGHGHGGHHGGAWKVAYADFVTAMMAFFLVMWIVNLKPEEKKSIESYFNDPVGISKLGTGGKDPTNAGANDSIVSLTALQAKKAMESIFVKAQHEIEDHMKKDPEFDKVKDAVQVSVTPEGLQIELVEKQASLFFDTGSAGMKPRAAKLLAFIARELGGIKAPIIIEGHTDAAPLGRPGGYSNWELSTDRANAARKAMEGHGLKKRQVLAVRGYADMKPARPKEPFHFSNRRVSILVAYGDKMDENQQSLK